MNKVIHLSLSRKSVPVIMDVVQGATAPAIDFVLDDYTPPGNARARLYIKKDGGEVYNDCTLSGNIATYTPTAGSFDVAGQCVAQLQITQGNTIAVSWRIFVTVEPNLIDGSAAPASTQYGALETLINNAQRYDSIIGSNNLTGANNRQGWIALTSGQDLNTVVTPNVYFAPSDAIASTLVNTPLLNGFKMLVECSHSSNARVRQTIYPVALVFVGQVYVRVTMDSGQTWTEWTLEPTRAEVNSISNRGGKNILPHTNTTTTYNGITYTKNADGSVTANGTATATSAYIIDTNYNSSYATGKRLTLTGCPSGGSSSTYRLMTIRTGGVTEAADTGDGASFTASGSSYRTQINIYQGTTVNNLTFYPMLRDASIQDDTYVPYGMSNAELTEKVNPKTKVVEGTSAADGSLGLGLNQAYSVIAVDLGGGGKWGIPFLYNRAWYVRCLNNVATYQVLANTSITATVYYLEQ